VLQSIKLLSDASILPQVGSSRVLARCARRCGIRESGSITAQMFEPAFARLVVRNDVATGLEGEEGQHLFQLALEFLHHLRRRSCQRAQNRCAQSAPARRPPRPDPPELRRNRRRGTRPSGASAPPGCGTNAPGNADAGGWIHHLGRTDDRAQSITDDQFTVSNRASITG